MFKNRKGFTIIELIVVMAVIAVLVLLAMPKFMGHTKEARLTELKNNIKQLENAAERYYINEQDWPRGSETPYTAEELESFANEIKNRTGAIVTLEPTGKYYPIDYEKLQKYVQKPRTGVYILQNPVGEVFLLDNLTPKGIEVFPEAAPKGEELPVTISGARFINGKNATFLLKPNGDVYAAGHNDWGNLGFGDNTHKSTFKKVDVSGVKDIIPGTYYTIFLKNDGTIWGTGHTSYFPATNTLINLEVTDVERVFVDGDAAIFIKKDGSVWRPGNALNGQLGFGADKAEKINITDVKDIVMSRGSTYFLKSDGTVLVTGENGYGQLGIGTVKYVTVPTKVNISNVKKIVTGTLNVFFIKNDGSVWSAGYNFNGERGTGNKNLSSIPTKTLIEDVSDVITGSSHTVFIKNDGTIWGCGSNGHFPLPITQMYITTPMEFPNEYVGFKKIICGEATTIVLKNDGTVLRNGNGFRGELGLDGPLPTGIKDIQGRGQRTFFVTDDGIWAAGFNIYGALGIDNGSMDASAPTPIVIED